MSKRGRRSGFANAGLICNQPVDRSGDPATAFAAIASVEQQPSPPAAMTGQRQRKVLKRFYVETTNNRSVTAPIALACDHIAWISCYRRNRRRPTCRPQAF